MEKRKNKGMGSTGDMRGLAECKPTMRKKEIGKRKKMRALEDLMPRLPEKEWDG